MTSLTKLMASTADPGKLRPLDVRRDLNHVADLMERCFADTLDADGQRYLRQMRSAAGNPGYIRWANVAAEGGAMPVSGYVWEEEGKVTGNLTLIPYYNLRQRYFLAANVAVDPDYRRKGIATSLTRKAVDHARARGAQAIWLQVRDENDGAIRLYRSLGFVERARRSTWLWERSAAAEGLTPGILDPTPSRGSVSVQLRRGGDWRLQRDWLEKAYPQDLNWHLALRQAALRPDLWGFAYRFLNDMHVRQWSAWNQGRLLGVLAWQSVPAYADCLWLATLPEAEDRAAEALLGYICRHPSLQRPIALDYPQGRAVQPIQASGFHLHQTLIWMSLEL